MKTIYHVVMEDQTVTFLSHEEAQHFLGLGTDEEVDGKYYVVVASIVDKDTYETIAEWRQ